jgi:hypothetical protein
MIVLPPQTEPPPLRILPVRDTGAQEFLHLMS